MSGKVGEFDNDRRVAGLVFVYRVTTFLENLEMSGNLEHVREMSGKKSCHGKVSQNYSLLDEY